MAASSSDTILSSTFSEEKWVAQTRKNLENQTPIEARNIPISVCHVPDSISVIKPQAYSPQVIALGPYHHFRPELYHMERYKIEVVKSYLTPHQIDLVIEKLRQIGPVVRACYHKYLEFDDETLALILAIDGLFLLYLLTNHLTHFADDASVYRDVMMLENQIPTIIFKEIRNTIHFSNDHDENDVEMFSMMQKFCKSQSPLETSSNQQFLQESKVLHLLDLLHEMITMHESIKVAASATQDVQLQRQASTATLQIESDDPLIKNVERIVANEAISSIKPIKLIASLPWDMISNLLGLSSGVKEAATKNPLVEEIEIPSVSKLSKLAGIMFEPAKGGIRDFTFDYMAATVYLPVITLNGNSEVILRNLVAYEVASSSSSTSGYNLVLAQYIDVMSGIINAKEDASLLRRRGIIKGDLTDSQVADLFNGMNKSSQKVYNETAAKINAYYYKRPKVKAHRFAKKYVYDSWKLLTVVSTVVLLLLLILQSFCNVYDCERYLH